MREYDFTLKFKLPDPNINPDVYIDKLYESGCDDALIGVGKKGYIGLDFTREADSADAAIRSAIENVKEAIPNSELCDVSPDFVGVTDLANLLGCSRQNMQKLISKDSSHCPHAVYDGAQSIWHLSEILTWLVGEKNYSVDETLIEVAKTTMSLNLAKHSTRIDPKMQESFKTLVA